MGIIIGGMSADDLILGGRPVSLYAGGNPPVKVWPTIREVVQITLGTQVSTQLRAALSDRGLDYRTVKEIPFDIELVGTGAADFMFNGCAALTRAPAMDTSQVTSMSGMFYGCSALTHVPDMDTRQVTDMQHMFINCSSLTRVPDMHASKVTYTTQMFQGCSSLTDGNVRLFGKHPNVSTRNMIYASGLTKEPFYDLVQITLGTGSQARDQFRAALTARGLNYQTVTDVPFGIELVGSGSVQNMFYGCAALTRVPAMYTSSVTNTSYMFYNCAALTHVPDLDTSSVTNTSYMFYNCAALTRVPDMDTSSVTNMGSMFQGCSSLTHAPVMDTGQVTGMLSMFRDCSALTYVPNLATSQVTNASYMFYGCAALTDRNVRLIGRHPNVGTYLMISRSGLTKEPFHKVSVEITVDNFYGARNQLRATLSDWGLDYTTVTELPFDIELVGTGSATQMFDGCAALTTVPSMYNSGVTSMQQMFRGCAALTHVPDMYTSRVVNMGSMFQGCSSLTDGNVRLFGKSQYVNTSNMIDNSGLTRLPFYDTNGNPV